MLIWNYVHELERFKEDVGEDFEDVGMRTAEIFVVEGGHAVADSCEGFVERDGDVRRLFLQQLLFLKLQQQIFYLLSTFLRYFEIAFRIQERTYVILCAQEFIKVANESFIICHTLLREI